MIGTILIIALVTLILLIYRSIRVDESVKKTAEKIPGPRLLPIIGNLNLFLSTDVRFSEILQKNWAKYGNRFRFLILNKLLLVTSEPKDIEVILANTAHKAEGYHLLKWLGDSLLVTTTEKAKKKRKLLMPSFHTEVLSINYAPVMEKVVGNLLKKMDQLKTNTIDICHIAHLFSVDLITETVLGLTVDLLLGDGKKAFVEEIRRISDCGDLRWKNAFYASDFIFYNSTTGKIEKKAEEKLSKFCDEIIQTRREAVKKEHVFIGGKRTALIDALLNATDENGNKFSDKDINYEIRGIFIAGHDTTHATISYFSDLISCNPDIQEKLYQEQLDIFGDDKEKVAGYEETQKMKYLEMTIKETLRLCSAAPAIGRFAMKDIQLDDITIPKGTNIFINLECMGRNEKIFPNPEKFDPQRFNPDSEEYRSRHPYAYIPFSAGVRNCIGQSFATWEMKCFISCILRNYKLLPSKLHKREFIYSLSTKPKYGTIIEIEKRV